MPSISQSVIAATLTVAVAFAGSAAAAAHGVDRSAARGDLAAWDEAAMIGVLQRPDAADHAAYGATDSAGNAMESPSILQLTGVTSRYAAVYHTPAATAGGNRYRVNLAVSDDLMAWTFVRTLLDNADMPRILRVQGASWIVLAHEQWAGPGPASSTPCMVTFRLFYTDADLLNGAIRATYDLPAHSRPQIDGTPSFYAAHLVQNDGYYSVDGQFGFHHWNGVRDVNDVTTITRLFDPRRGQTASFPSTATGYNNKLIANGVTGNIGQRDTIAEPFGRYNVQEGNTGRPGASWDRWRLWLYRYVEPFAYPTGAGSVRPLNPITPNGSVSFGNPSIRVVDAPDRNGRIVWVSYFLFFEGAGPGEAGSLIYWKRVP